MFGSQILEVASGIALVFILVSTICLAIREGLEAWFKTRAAFLEYGIRELLNDKTGEGLAAHFYRHPQIFSLYHGDYRGRKLARPNAWSRGGDLPSYIPARNFALALMDMAARGPDRHAVNSGSGMALFSLNAIQTNLSRLNNERVQHLLLNAIDCAQGDINKAQTFIEAWFDSAMDRVSGWYKRSTQWMIFWISLAVAVVMNINTITIADYLYRNDVARAALFAQAAVSSSDPNLANRGYNEARKALDEIGLPIGWAADRGTLRPAGEPRQNEKWYQLAWEFSAPVFGWLLTAFAAVLGTPFWFDVLNKVMVIRSTVKPHEKSPEEGSEDRPAKKRRPPAVPG